MHVSVTSYIQQSGIFPVDSTGSHKLKDKEKDKYRGGEVNSRISPKVYCNNTPRKRFYGDWIPPHSCKILLRGPRAPARVVHRYLSEEERERRKEKEEKEEEELFVWSTSSHSTTALFFAALRGTLAYREPCWRMYDPRVPRGSPSSIRGRWTLSVPRGKNLFRRGRRGSLSAEARRAEDVLTSTRRSP